LILLEAYARIELGDAAAGVAAAKRLLEAEDAHESVLAEARVVWAAALDAQGRRDEAIAMMKELGRATLEPLSELGQPRARVLAAAALVEASGSARAPNLAR
jgi:poly-beta-hydroxyalkanoate depolymerase